MNEIQLLIAGVLISAAIMWPCFQWYTWYHRAVNADQHARNFKAAIDGKQQQMNLIADERKLHYDTLNEVFDFIDDNGPWGVNDIKMTALRLKLMDVLKDSSVGRV